MCQPNPIPEPYMLPQPGDDWLLVENDVGHYGVLEHFAHYYYRYISQIDKLSC